MHKDFVGTALLRANYCKYHLQFRICSDHRGEIFMKKSVDKCRSIISGNENRLGNCTSDVCSVAVYNVSAGVLQC